MYNLFLFDFEYVLYNCKIELKILTILIISNFVIRYYILDTRSNFDEFSWEKS